MRFLVPAHRVLALAAALVAVPAVAQTTAGPSTPDDVATLAGAWDLSLEGTNRRCRVVLGVESVGVGRVVRFPAGCRRALPILAAAGGWTVPERGAVRLVDAAGGPTLQFQRQSEDLLVARSQAGENFRLERAEGARQARLAPPPPPPAIGVPQVTPVDPAKAPPPATVPGVYFVDRYTEREVCRVSLTPILLTAAGLHEARILDGCRDPGLAAFDPVSWRYEAGRLTLTARRGHEVSLISERAGQWRRDPEVGAALLLRRTPP